MFINGFYKYAALSAMLRIWVDILKEKECKKSFHLHVLKNDILGHAHWTVKISWYESLIFWTELTQIYIAINKIDLQIKTLINENYVLSVKTCLYVWVSIGRLGFVGV